MISDPCNAELVPGLYGDSRGLLARLKSTVENTSDNTAGYCLWVPSFHNDPKEPISGANVAGNLYVYVTNAPGTSPVGIGGGSPWATGGTITGALADPCSGVLSTSVFMDARTLSACMKMRYFGALENSSGEVGFIDNLPLSVLFGRHVVGGPQTPAIAVDDLFVYSARTQRVGLDTLENVWYNANESTKFHPYDTGIILAGTFPDLTQAAMVENPTAFGFCWRGLDNGVTSTKLTFEFVKNIEWRPDPYLGISAPAQRTSASNPAKTVVAALDASAPGWNHKVEEEKGDTTSLTKAVFSGINSVGKAIGKVDTSGFSFEKFIDSALESGIKMLPEIAPLLLL